jgi:hypothetical protein
MGVADQLRAPFVIGQQHGVKRRRPPQIGLHRGPGGIQLGRVGAAVLAHEAGVEPAGRHGVTGAGVVEQRKGFLKKGHQSQSFMSCLMLARFAMSSSIVGSLASARFSASLVAS